MENGKIKLNLKTYLIPNCGTTCENACECLASGSISEKLKTAKIVDFSTKVDGNKSPLSHSDQAGGFSCLFTPPVPHTCSYNPLGTTDEKEQLIEGMVDEDTLCKRLEKLPSVAKADDGQLDRYMKDCTGAGFPSDENQCSNEEGSICFVRRKAMHNDHPECPNPETPSSKPSQVKSN